ncbi:hypothetical protein BBP40_007971 [Aspergillus hancockii]|nr:hypothetical protein BBP40_007971 [Aspergillus hancockii]
MTIESTVGPQPFKDAKEARTGPKSEGVWKVLDRFLPFTDPNCRLWWENMAPVLGRSLALTGYSTESQYKYLLFLQSVLVPFLGPYPNQNGTNVTWHSCIAGDRGPLDISVNYQSSKSTFRITIEPIGANAGTEVDPMNGIAPRQLLQLLSNVQPGIDLTWYNQLERDLIINNRDARQSWNAISQYFLKTQTLIGVDLNEGSFTVKAYFFPHLRASATGEDWASMLFNSARKLCGAEKFQRELSMIEHYIGSIRHKIVPEKPNLAFDCVSPARSRVKIYAAVDMSCLEDVYDFWTIGGYLKGPEIQKGFQIVKRMWSMIYPKDLPNGTLRESMTVHCNWELSPADPTPVPKAYFLVSEDYDKNITSALIDVFNELGWDEHIKTHQALEEEAYSMCDMSTSTDVYTWLSFAYSKKSGPYITVYTKPIAGDTSLG